MFKTNFNSINKKNNISRSKLMSISNSGLQRADYDDDDDEDL